MKLKRKSVSVTVSRTIQLVQFHPATLTVAETADVPDGMDPEEAKLELYKSAAASVDKFLRQEQRKFNKENEK